MKAGVRLEQIVGVGLVFCSDRRRFELWEGFVRVAEAEGREPEGGTSQAGGHRQRTPAGDPLPTLPPGACFRWRHGERDEGDGGGGGVDADVSRRTGRAVR